MGGTVMLYMRPNLWCWLPLVKVCSRRIDVSINMLSKVVRIWASNLEGRHKYLELYAMI